MIKQAYVYNTLLTIDEACMSLFSALLVGQGSGCCGNWDSGFITDLTLEDGTWVWGEGGEAYNSSMDIWATDEGEPNGPVGVMGKSNLKLYDVSSSYKHHLICEREL